MEVTFFVRFSQKRRAKAILHDSHNCDVILAC